MIEMIKAASIVAGLLVLYALTGCVTLEYAKRQYLEGKRDANVEQLRECLDRENKADLAIQKEKARVLMKALDRIAEKSCRDDDTESMRDLAAQTAHETDLKLRRHEDEQKLHYDVGPTLLKNYVPF